jgi:hypothetical protein
MTDGRNEAHRRLASYIERHQFVSVMNDTKWREAIACLQCIPGFPVVFRVRCVRDPIDAPLHRDRSFPWHVPPFQAIEWLDVDPRVRLTIPPQDFTDPILNALKALPVPVSREDGYLRIWGYYRPGVVRPHLL